MGTGALMHPAGHLAMHMPQPVHFAKSITARFPSTAIAFSGQTLAQREHPIHPTEQTFFTSGPFHFELQVTHATDVFGAKVKTDLGQAEIHAPQPTHFFGSMEASPSTMDIAPKGQTLTHVPNPMQLNGQALGEPPGRTAADRQSCIPS
jgi:hypothetical protein